MTAPTPVTVEVRERALRLLRLSDQHPAADRVDEIVPTVLELIRVRLGLAAFTDLPDTPAPVMEAAAQATVEMYRRKDAPFGITGAWSAEGEAFRISRDPLAGVEYLLTPYLPSPWQIA